MSDRCATCPWRTQPMPERDPVAELRRWCQENGHHVGPGDVVHEDVAGLILDRSPGTLRNWRARGGGQLPFMRHGRTGRVRYKLSDLADVLEAARFDE